MMRFLIGFFLCVATAVVFAADPGQFFEEWTRVDLTGPLGAERSNLRYLVDFENRDDQLRPDFGVGYRFTPLVAFWSGYTQIISLDDRPLLYRPWQQMIWELLDRKQSPMLLQIRSRFDELKQEGQPEWSWRWRERIVLP